MLSVIGIGPGSQAMMTMEAVEALQAAEIVVGYKTYTHLVKAFTGDKQVIKTGMCKEIERCQAAIELAQAGHNVALISSATRPSTAWRGWCWSWLISSSWTLRSV